MLSCRLAQRCALFASSRTRLTSLRSVPWSTPTTLGTVSASAVNRSPVYISSSSYQSVAQAQICRRHLVSQAYDTQDDPHRFRTIWIIVVWLFVCCAFDFDDYLNGKRKIEEDIRSLLSTLPEDLRDLPFYIHLNKALENPLLWKDIIDTGIITYATDTSIRNFYVVYPVILKLIVNCEPAAIMVASNDDFIRKILRAMRDEHWTAGDVVDVREGKIPYGHIAGDIIFYLLCIDSTRRELLNRGVLMEEMETLCSREEPTVAISLVTAIFQHALPDEIQRLREDVHASRALKNLDTVVSDSDRDNKTYVEDFQRIMNGTQPSSIPDGIG